jgi:hypothetical protein
VFFYYFKDKNHENEKKQHERNLKITQNLTKYFDERMNAQFTEMVALIGITSDSIRNYSRYDELTLKTILHKRLDEDIEKIKRLNKEVKLYEHDPHSFRVNKLLDLLTQSKKYIDINWPSIRDGDSVKLLSNSKGISWYGTSMLNYMQTSMLEILSIIYETPVSDLKCLRDANIYQLNTSPNIQSTYVANHDAYVESKIKKFEIMKSWRWSTEDKEKTPKLVIPSLGFAWGGTRFDKEFKDKYFKTHDCSSFVGNYIKYDKLKTELLRCLTDQLNPIDDYHLQIGLDGLKHLLNWKADLVLPEPGHIFWIKFYCGFIIDVDSENKKVTALGFNRWMPFIEGLRKDTYQMNDEGKWYRLYESNLVSELSEYVGETNENSKIVPASAEKMFFFEVTSNF